MSRSKFGEQLPLDFSVSASQRLRREQKRTETAAQERPSLFAAVPADIDVSLHSPSEAVATLGGDPDVSRRWLERIVGPTQVIKGRRVSFGVEGLDRLLAVRPPAKATLDAASGAVSRGVWAHALGFGPLVVFKKGARLLAASPSGGGRWPPGLAVKDVPWTAVVALAHLGVPLDIRDAGAAALLASKLAKAGESIARAGLAGSAIHIETDQPQLIEALGLPALAYAGLPDSGRYRIPVLAAEPLLSEPVIELTADAAAAIRRVSGRVKPLHLGDDFPWTLYDFQARDAAIAQRILETAGGVLLAGDMGSGKLVKSDEFVWNEQGSVRIGDLTVGDWIFGCDGKLHAVTGVFPQGVKQMYRMKFSDGSYLDSGAEHLWSVHSPVQKNCGRPGKVLSTLELLEGGLKDAGGNTRWYIPVCEPVQFDTNERLPIPGYALGMLLGDGSFVGQRAQLTNADLDSLRDAVDDLRLGGFHELTYTVTQKKSNAAEQWSLYANKPGTPVKFDPLVRALKGLDLYGKRSWEKFVPTRYRFAREEVRRALLQGLLDSDGGPCDTTSASSIEFCSTSEQLADDVVWLVNSLGGTARKAGPRNTTYTYKGEKKFGRDSWRVSLALPDHVTPFRCARKRNLYKRRVKYQPTREIVSIEPTTIEEAVCIAIDAPDKLFLAGEHLVATHNTTISLGLVHHLDLWPLLVVAPLAAFSTWARQLGEMGKNFYLATEPGPVAWPTIASGAHDAVVISYDRLHAYVELIETLDFKVIIADELQKTSSPGSRRSRALRQLAQAFPMRVGLSGTPMSNTLNDLLPLGSFLIPGEWKPRASSKDLTDLYPGDPIESVAEHLGAMMVRRRMDQVGVKLPDKTVSRVFVQLSGEQRRALEDLQKESEQEVEAADGQVSRMHVFAKLMKMRQIVSCPSQAGIAGPNPKVATAVGLAEEFWAMNRKSVLFCANRGTWRELGAACDAAGLKWVGIWGSSTVADRIEAERRYHQDPEVSVFIGTIQSCAEALTLSPTGTAWISCDYLYNPSTLSQAEARIYRLNTTEAVDIIYLHAQVPGGGLDDRMVEILEMKRALIAQVVDRREHVDKTSVHYSLGDLVYLLTGHRDEKVDRMEADKKAVVAAEQEKKRQGKVGAHKRKYKNDVTVDLKDDGRAAVTLEDWKAANAPEADVDDLLDEEAVTDIVEEIDDPDEFDTDDD